MRKHIVAVKFKKGGRPQVIESYCENKQCQVRSFEFVIKLYESESIAAKNLHCPLCGRKTSYWLTYGEWK